MNDGIVNPDAIARLFGTSDPKEVQLISVNGVPVVPVGPPHYQTPWPNERIHERFLANRCAFLDEEEVVDMMLEMRADFDKLLSKAQYDLYICQSPSE